MGHVYGEINEQIYDHPDWVINDTCAVSMYQALSPPLKEPGHEATPSCDKDNLACCGYLIVKLEKHLLCYSHTVCTCM